MHKARHNNGKSRNRTRKHGGPLSTAAAPSPIPLFLEWVHLTQRQNSALYKKVGSSGCVSLYSSSADRSAQTCTASLSQTWVCAPCPRAAPAPERNRSRAQYFRASLHSPHSHRHRRHHFPEQTALRSLSPYCCSAAPNTNLSSQLRPPSAAPPPSERSAAPNQKADQKLTPNRKIHVRHSRKNKKHMETSENPLRHIKRTGKAEATPPFYVERLCLVPIPSARGLLLSVICDRWSILEDHPPGGTWMHDPDSPTSMMREASAFSSSVSKRQSPRLSSSGVCSPENTKE